MFTRFIQNPYINLVSGFVLLFTSGYETWISFEEFSLASHHGILLFSLIHITKTIPEILQGSKELNTAEKAFN